MMNLRLHALAVKTIDAGFSDQWYQASAPVGDMLTAPQLVERVGIAQRAMNIVANSVQSIPLDIKRGEKIIVDADPLNWAETRNQAASDAIVFGAFYFVAEYIGGRVSLRRILPSDVRIIFERGELVRFEVTEFSGVTRYAPADLIWWWEQRFTPGQGPGASIMETALKDGNLVNASASFSLAWFLRGGTSRVWFADENTRPEELERLTGWLNRATSGFRNWFKNIVLRSGFVDSKELGSDPKAGEVGQTSKGAEERFIGALGVPASMIFANAANYATAQQDSRNLISLTSLPLAERTIVPFRDKLFRPMGYDCEFHPERMSAFSEVALQNSTTLLQLQQAGAMSMQTMQRMLNIPVTPRRVTVAPPSSAEPTPQAQIAAPGELPMLPAPALSEPVTANAAPLNGAQIGSAIEILGNVAAGTLSDYTATQLIIALGIDADRARQMVESSRNAVAPEIAPKSLAEIELKNWRAHAIKNLGKPSARKFIPAATPEPQARRIETLLGIAETEAEVAAIFDGGNAELLLLARAIGQAVAVLQSTP